MSELELHVCEDERRERRSTLLLLDAFESAHAIAADDCCGRAALVRGARAVTAASPGAKASVWPALRVLLLVPEQAPVGVGGDARKWARVSHKSWTLEKAPTRGR
jgi:hypothetical protein